MSKLRGFELFGVKPHTASELHGIADEKRAAEQRRKVSAERVQREQSARIEEWRESPEGQRTLDAREAKAKADLEVHVSKFVSTLIDDIPAQLLKLAEKARDNNQNIMGSVAYVVPNEFRFADVQSIESTDAWKRLQSFFQEYAYTYQFYSFAVTAAKKHRLFVTADKSVSLYKGPARGISYNGYLEDGQDDPYLGYLGITKHRNNG